MDVETITVSRTFNLGNYDSLKLEITVTPEEGQATSKCIKTLNDFLVDQAKALYADRKVL